MDEQRRGDRRRLTPRAIRRLRILGASSLVLLIAAGGATALWLSTRAPEPRPAVSRAGGPSPPPVRLDTLPASPEPPPDALKRAEGEREERRPRRQEGRREGSGSEGGSRAEMRRELADLAGEDDRLRAALAGDIGPGRGTGELVWPLGGRLLARFGRVLGVGHTGIDIKARAGTPVHAADAGRVAISERFGGYGNLICVQHTGTLSTCYGHNSRLRVDEGETVESGDVIARSGCSGDCYEPHLHFEVREDGEAVNPRQYLGPVRGGRVFGALP